ncbi:MAG: Xaa-Pro peptidase family protein [bacterium]|nr:Xaa-Pro peptidase family protein [bacterium]
MNYKKRIERVRELLDKKNIPVILIKSPSNIFYLTGLLDIEGTLIVDPQNIILFVSGIYYQEVVDIAHFKMEIVLHKKEEFGKFLKRYKKIGVVETEISLAYYNLVSHSNKVIPLKDFIKEIRMTKDEEEITFIKKALTINKMVFNEIKNCVEEGLTETMLSGHIHYLIRRYGGRREAFEPIVASGTHSAYPHHKNRNKKIEKGKPLIVDAGVDYNGYKSDLTRTFFPGGTQYNKFMDYFKILKDILECVKEFINTGKTGEEIYNYALALLKKRNIDRYFVHGLGHGVGIDVHELPVLAPGSKDVIKDGCVFTVEPGIYIPGEGGIRLEEMVIL